MKLFLFNTLDRSEGYELHLFCSINARLTHFEASTIFILSPEWWIIWVFAFYNLNFIHSSIFFKVRQVKPKQLLFVDSGELPISNDSLLSCSCNTPQHLMPPVVCNPLLLVAEEPIWIFAGRPSKPKCVSESVLSSIIDLWKCEEWQNHEHEKNTDNSLPIDGIRKCLSQLWRICLFFELWLLNLFDLSLLLILSLLLFFLIFWVLYIILLRLILLHSELIKLDNPDQSNQSERFYNLLHLLLGLRLGLDHARDDIHICLRWLAIENWNHEKVS